MAIRNTGPLPITEIVSEFGGSTPHGLSEYYGNGSFLSPGYFPNPPALPSTGSALNIGAFYGKSRRRTLTATIASNSVNLNAATMFSNLRESSVATDCYLTINSGVTVYSSINSASLVLNAPLRAGDTFTLINRGNIIGFSGTGGDGGCGTGNAGKPGTMGGWGLALYAPTTIINSGIIAGGSNGGNGGNGGVITSSSPCSDAVQCTSCQVRFVCTRYAQQNYIRSYTQGCQRGECCDSRTAMQFMNKNMSDQCWCGSCKDTPRDPGCYGPCQAQYAQKNMACQTGYNQYAGSCTGSTNVCGGKGGNGATAFSNVGLLGSPSGGGTSTAGLAGGTWGGGYSIVGTDFLTSKNIGGTVLGATLAQSF